MPIENQQPKIVYPTKEQLYIALGLADTDVLLHGCVWEGVTAVPRNTHDAESYGHLLVDVGMIMMRFPGRVIQNSGGLIFAMANGIEVQTLQTADSFEVYARQKYVKKEDGAIG